MAPGIGAREPRGGNPPRTMPMPWPKPGTELGRTKRGSAPVRVFAVTCAPRSIRSCTTPGWFSRTATISAVPWVAFSFVSTLAPRSSRSRTASTLPARDAAINGVSPARSTSFASAPASRSARIIGASPLVEASASGVETDPVGQLRIGASIDEQLCGLDVARTDEPVERWGAVGTWRVHVHFLRQEGPNRRPCRGSWLRRQGAYRRLREARR